jgi:hypothetical protein
LYRTSISPIFTEQIVLGLRDYFTRVWGEHAFGAGMSRQSRKFRSGAK